MWWAWALGALAASVFFGLLTSTLAEHKGYLNHKGDGQYLWLGALTWLVGFLYVGFLPEEPRQFTRKVREALKQNS